MSGVGISESLGVLAADARAFALASARIALLVVAALIVVRLLRTSLRSLEARLVRDRPGAGGHRLATYLRLLGTSGAVAVWVAITLIALDQLGLNVVPLLTGAGIAGLAVGFGAQSLVRDTISGFLLVVEDHVRVGDTVSVNGRDGVVEALTFRTLLLRDAVGALHVFPHGSITHLANLSRGWSVAVVEVNVAYGEDVDRVTAVMTEVGRALAADPAWGPRILEPAEVVGVTALRNTGVTIQARVRTRPAEQAAVAHEYRRRLKRAFETENIAVAG
jgi:moderate conductance mechanosensitive channel